MAGAVVANSDFPVNKQANKVLINLICDKFML